MDVRGNVLWEPFPDEDGDEDRPEKDAPLALEEDALSTVHSVEKLDLRHQERVDRPCGIDQVGASDAGETVTDELRGDQSTYSHHVMLGSERHHSLWGRSRTDA